MAADARASGPEESELTDTIFALSSGAPPAAVAIIRISGPGADGALEALADRLPEPRRAVRRSLFHRGELLDTALVIRFPGPASATGEDLVELHLHGGRSVVAALLAALATMEGLRPAEPGEFTRRAFENGRIDLSEAEGLADLLAAETQSQRRAALALAGGALSRVIEKWQQRLLELSAGIEANLDFADEADGEVPLDPTGIGELRDEMTAWLRRPSAERLREGVRIVVAGPPNAGKSSLLNALSGRDAAIVSPVAGTTRDLVEAPIALAGTPLLLVDTAGLRESADQVESIGVERARAMIEYADLILWLGAPAACPDRERAITIHPKADLGPADAEADLAVSTVTGQGLEALEQMLTERAQGLLPPEGEVAINARHRLILETAVEWLAEAEKAIDPIIAAEALRQARVALDGITGRAGVEQMLDTLFGRFCIGK